MPRTISSSPIIPDLSPVLRFQEYRIVLDALNDGAPLPAAFPGLVRYGQAQSSVNQVMMGGGGVQAVYKEGADSKRLILVKPSAVNFCLMAFRPAAIGGAQRQFAISSGLGILNTTSPVTAGDAVSEQAVSIMAFVRKNAAGDNTSCWFFLGFADLTVLNGNAKSAVRTGLLGDGAGGFRFGSVNGPDGFVAGLNARNDIDANAVQPAELQAPGANWFHVRIKMTPPTIRNPTGGKWEAFLNNSPTPAATFTQAVNFPRGSQGTSHNYNRVEACCMHGNNTDGVTVEPGVLLHDVRIWIEDIL